MLRITGFTHAHQQVGLGSLDELTGRREELLWFWVDFDRPTAEESSLLDTYFHFHPLAIEDCYHLLQRPKMDHYDEVKFFVLHSIRPPELTVEEVNIFLGSRFLVTYHTCACEAVDNALDKLCAGLGARSGRSRPNGPLHAAYLVIDKLVDQYFPAAYELEDQIGELDNRYEGGDTRRLMDELFDIRSRLLKLRRTVVPMRELLYRILSSDRIEGLKEQHAFFADVHDHLLRLSEIIDGSREMTADIRDNYLSVNANRMNTIMKTLTVITTIFMPLTFLAGLYGMNFHNMPELSWRWGYFVLLAVMAVIGSGMYGWFRRKGWFD